MTADGVMPAPEDRNAAAAEWNWLGMVPRAEAEEFARLFIAACWEAPRAAVGPRGRRPPVGARPVMRAETASGTACGRAPTRAGRGSPAAPGVTARRRPTESGHQDDLTLLTLLTGGDVTEADEARCHHIYNGGECMVECQCGRGSYCFNNHSSCYDCFLDRRADYVECIYCSGWHSPEFDTCFKCRPQGRDEAATDLKRVILTRDSFRCRYCGIREGDDQVDPRLIRPKCPPGCAAEHNHRRACKPKCGQRHKHRKQDDPNICEPWCSTPHSHLVKDDDGVRPAKLHIDHIQPCAKDGTADPWNLQTLCGVCNVTKGRDWWDGSRHWWARRRIMAAYLTYLWDFLTADQQDDLACDAGLGRLDHAEARRLIVEDYIQQIEACRSRPEPCADVVIEDVPPEYAAFDLPAY